MIFLSPREKVDWKTRKWACKDKKTLFEGELHACGSHELAWWGSQMFHVQVVETAKEGGGEEEEEKEEDDDYVMMM